MLQSALWQHSNRHASILHSLRMMFLLHSVRMPVVHVIWRMTMQVLRDQGCADH